MIEINIDGTKISISSFIYHLFYYGDNSHLIKWLKEYICNDVYKDDISNFLKDVIDYFIYSSEAMIDFIEFTSPTVHCKDDVIETILHFKEHDGDMLNMMREHDKGSYLLYKNTNGTMPLHVYNIINSALALYILGLTNNANGLITSGVFFLIRHYFELHIIMDLHKRLVNRAVSDHQREKARKQRNPYYNEVMLVIKLTWRKYPKASKTGLLNRLSSYYDGKVSRNTLNKWIKESGAQPPKPDKYSSFVLVHPPPTAGYWDQITGNCHQQPAIGLKIRYPLIDIYHRCYLDVRGDGYEFKEI